MRNYIEWIVRFRWAVVLIILGLTGFVIKNLGNLSVIIDPNTFVPQHLDTNGKFYANRTKYLISCH